MAKRHGRGAARRGRWLVWSAWAAWLAAQSGCTVICIDGDHNRVDDAGGHGKISMPVLGLENGHAPRHDDARTPAGR